MTHLNLTQGEQDWLAEVARKAASISYSWFSQEQEERPDSIGEWLMLHSLEFKPQFFHSLYDKLHRTGANS